VQGSRTLQELVRSAAAAAAAVAAAAAAAAAEQEITPCWQQHWQAQHKHAQCILLHGCYKAHTALLYPLAVNMHPPPPSPHSVITSISFCWILYRQSTSLTHTHTTIKQHYHPVSAACLTVSACRCPLCWACAAADALLLPHPSPPLPSHFTPFHPPPPLTPLILFTPPPSCIQLRESGGVDCIVRLLGSSDAHTQRAAVVALRCLSTTNDTNKQHMVKCGALELLVKVCVCKEVHQPCVCFRVG